MRLFGFRSLTTRPHPDGRQVWVFLILWGFVPWVEFGFWSNGIWYPNGAGTMYRRYRVVAWKPLSREWQERVDQYEAEHNAWTSEEYGHLKS